MAKSQNTKGVTPVGEALFAHVLKTESFNEKDTGKFTIMLKLKESDKDSLLAKIEGEWDKFKDTLDKKKFKCEPSFGMKEYKDDEYFKFSMNECIRLKSGEELHKTVPIYDCDLKEISKTLTGLGNGSKVRVAYELVPFYMNDKNFGVSLRMTGIQIIEYVAYGSQSGEALGFDKAEGFHADEAVETPFGIGNIPLPDDADYNEDGDF